MKNIYDDQTTERRHEGNAYHPQPKIQVSAQSKDASEDYIGPQLPNHGTRHVGTRNTKRRETPNRRTLSSQPVSPADGSDIKMKVHMRQDQEDRLYDAEMTDKEEKQHTIQKNTTRSRKEVESYNTESFSSYSAGVEGSTQKKSEQAQVAYMYFNSEDCIDRSGAPTSPSGNNSAESSNQNRYEQSKEAHSDSEDSINLTDFVAEDEETQTVVAFPIIPAEFPAPPSSKSEEEIAKPKTYRWIALSIVLVTLIVGVVVVVCVGMIENGKKSSRLSGTRESNDYPATESSTAPPITHKPSTIPPSIPQLSTPIPTTPESGTAPPITHKPSTIPPSIPQLSTPIPTTPESGTAPPITHKPSTLPPSIPQLSTPIPTTPESGTAPPITHKPSTIPPSLPQTSTPIPTTPESGTAPPITHKPSTIPPSLPQTSTIPPTTPEPTTQPLTSPVAWEKHGSDIYGENAGDQFGYLIALSGDGSTIAGAASWSDVGGEYAGSVRVFRIKGNSWTQIGHDIDGIAGESEFAMTVATSYDGSVVAIGGPTYGFTFKGRVRVFEYNRVTDWWSPLGDPIYGLNDFDVFGSSVSLSGNGRILAVGACLADENGEDSGHVRVFGYGGGTEGWDQVGQTIGGENSFDLAGDRESVKLSHDGEILSVGSALKNSKGFHTGHVRMFRYDRNANEWTQMGQDIQEANTGDIGFGLSVDLSRDGTMIAIGAPGYDIGGQENCGLVQVYAYDNGDDNWYKVFGLIGLEGDECGISVSLSGDGKKVAFGCDQFDIGEKGELFIYQDNKELGKWVNTLYVAGEKNNDNFGVSVSLSDDGNVVAAGGHGNDGNGDLSGRISVYKLE